jgi:hypothetical protein
MNHRSFYFEITILNPQKGSKRNKGGHKLILVENNEIKKFELCGTVSSHLYNTMPKLLPI